MSPYCLIKRDMAYKQVLLTMNSQMYRQAKAKSKKNCYKNIQDYIINTLRRDLFKKRAGGRPRLEEPELAYLKKFAKPTKKSRHLINLARRQGTL